jgi:diguanylate cyclase (GGDEF)-like protein
MVACKGAEIAMASGSSKNQIISDYAAFLKALLPETIGSCCHDHKGRMFFHEKDANPKDFPHQYQGVLTKILLTPIAARKIGKMKFEKATAFIIPLIGNEEKTLGTLTVLVKPGLNLSFAAATKKIRTVTRTLERELSLRYRLVAAYKQLSVRSAEENLLHQVEKLVHLNRPCEKTLRHVLLLCRRYLKVEGAALFIPERNIRLTEGEALKPVEVQAMLGDMTEQIEFQTHDPLVIKDTVSFSQELDVLVLPVCHGQDEAMGILALSGWTNSSFSDRRRRRIGRYVVALIEDVVARDYDSLTGLMSWANFEPQLLEECRGGDSDRRFCLYFDIDQLHVINETFGLDKGDEVLATFGRLLREQLQTKLITRVTGDRFTAFLSDTDVDGARGQAEAVSHRFQQLEYVRGEQTIKPTVSIGIGPVAGDPKVASAAMAMAQVACRAAKERGRGRIESFHTGDDSIIRRLDDIHMVGHIRGAIANDRLMLDVQPIVPISGDRDSHHYYEVLVRLISPTGGQVLPGEFFSAAERYQLMEELDRWVVSQALKLLAARMEQLRDLPLRIAINLSGQSLGSEEFLPFVEQEIREKGVPPEMLCFEITETVAVANQQSAQKFMHTLQKLGCRFSLDDFGTGLSSFAYLKLFPVDTLKIDGSFVKDITTNVTSQSVVAAIAEVARVMNLETVAEYVQNEEAMNLLQDLGVTWGQGFLLGTPESMIERLDKLTTRSEAADILV